MSGRPFNWRVFFGLSGIASIVLLTLTAVFAILGGASAWYVGPIAFTGQVILYRVTVRLLERAP